MTMLAIHNAAVMSKVASYHEFLSRFSKHSKVVYGFVEGKQDPAFYRGFIDLMLPGSWTVELWPAGNKDSVYRIHAGMDWGRFPKTRICFFVDRDLSDLIPERLTEDSNIYVTFGYSIENELAKKTVCQRVLIELCGFAKIDHTEMDSVCELFEQEFESFLKEMIPVMAWILVWRRKQKRPNLNDIIMSDLFTFKAGRLQVNPSPKGKATIAEYLHDQCNLTMDPAVDIKQSSIDLIQNDNYKKFTRGKFVFWFLVEFCLAIHRDAIAFFNGVTEPPKMNVTLASSNGMTVVGVRSKLPECLRNFLKATYCDYIERNSSGVT